MKYLTILVLFITCISGCNQPQEPTPAPPTWEISRKLSQLKQAEKRVQQLKTERVELLARLRQAEALHTTKPETSKVAKTKEVKAPKAFTVCDEQKCKLTPEDVLEAVKSIKGDRMTIVTSNPELLTNNGLRPEGPMWHWYACAAKMAGKKITGIYLYTQNSMRMIAPGGELFLHGHYSAAKALKVAAQDKPDSIILVTDYLHHFTQKFDRSLARSLPPVVAHCMRPAQCRSHLTTLAKVTGGTYLEEIEVDLPE